MDDLMREFFTLASSALKGESLVLQELLDKYEREQGFYGDYHHGFPFLIETGIVYLIWKHALESGFAARWRCEVRWEVRAVLLLPDFELDVPVRVTLSAKN